MNTECQTCTDRKANGRPSGAPIHCRHCHATWTGNEAQHCVRCHHTFSSSSGADTHRYRRLVAGGTEDRCIDPAVERWRQMRPGVWTNAEAWAGPS
jgi:hypothetical protein